MLKRVHQALVDNNLSRKYERRFTRWIKNQVGAPDAYFDLYNCIRTHKPAAILDLGAFQGETVVRFLDECVTPIHAFEPTPKSAEFLRRRFAKEPRVQIHQMALSNKEGTARFFLNSNPQTNSLLDNDQGNKESFGDGVTHLQSYEVATVGLDDWLKKSLPAGSLVIKADVQGAEGLLLDGGRDAFKNRVIAFYSEVQINPMYVGQADFFTIHKRMTDEFGFYLHQIYPCLVDPTGVAVQTDVLWLKKMP